MASSAKEEEGLIQDISIGDSNYQFYDVTVLGEAYEQLPYCLRIIAECLLRKGLNDKQSGSVWKDSLARLLDYRQHESVPILFHPGRVLLQDFTGVPALIDLAAMRDIIKEKGQDPGLVDSLCPADLVVDHTVQLDYSQIVNSLKKKKKTPQQQQQQQQQQQLACQVPQPVAPPPLPTIIVHSLFPPPSMAIVQPGFYPNQTYSVYPQQQQQQQQQQAIYPHNAWYPDQTLQFQPPNQADMAETAATDLDEIACDNPGLPIQEEICPFHQRMSKWCEVLRSSQEDQFSQNAERFGLLKWVNHAFNNITVIPPGTGVMHQVNLEYLARIVTCQDNLLFPDSVIGTDSHTTMINGLGVLSWCVGTMEAESVMFGHPISFPIPKVVGCKIFGTVPKFATSTEIVLLITKKLRHVSLSGNFVEFYGPGIAELSIADRATIANMCPEYCALVGFFPADDETIQYLVKTGRDKQKIKCMKEYLSKIKLLRSDEAHSDPKYSSLMEIDLSEVQPCLSGPKRPKDKVNVQDLAKDFKKCLTDHSSNRGFGVAPDQVHTTFSVNVDGVLHQVTHGSVLLAAITSCSNTSNPTVMLGAGLLAKKAIEAGLSVNKFVRTSLAPGSGIVTTYLQESGVMPYLYMLGFEIVGYGCKTCVENYRSMPSPILDAMKQGSLVCCGMLSGNRNFEGRINPDIKANYLASPMLVIAYAIFGRVDVDLTETPLGYNPRDEPIYLSDIWPTRKEIQEVERSHVIPAIFSQVHPRVSFGNKHWSKIPIPEEKTFQWNDKSSFIRSPEYIQEIHKDLDLTAKINLTGMRCLLKLGDNVTSDQISPAGSIARNCPAAEYLAGLGLAPRDYNSYGARRGNCQIMMRGTFAHIKLDNKLSLKSGPHTIHFPSEVPTSVFEAARRYKADRTPIFVVGGKQFGRGASRDWATKGPFMLGIRAILAKSFNPTYRANLVKTGILPVEIDDNTYDILTGREKLTIVLPDLESKNSYKEKTVKIVLNDEFDLNAYHCLDNLYEGKLFANGGVIKQLLRNTLNTKAEK